MERVERGYGGGGVSSKEAAELSRKTPNLVRAPQKVHFLRIWARFRQFPSFSIACEKSLFFLNKLYLLNNKT